MTLKWACEFPAGPSYILLTLESAVFHRIVELVDPDVYEHLRHLITVRLFICARVYLTFIKAQYLRSRNPQQYRRMRHYNELRIILCTDP